MVVLPLEPVTAATGNSGLGSPKKSAAAGPIAGRARDDELRHGDLELPLADERDGADPHGVGREVVPFDARAGDAEEERAGRRSPYVLGELRHVDRGERDNLGRRERLGEALEVHHGPSLPTAPARPCSLRHGTCAQPPKPAIFASIRVQRFCASSCATV